VADNYRTKTFMRSKKLILGIASLAMLLSTGGCVVMSVATTAVGVAGTAVSVGVTAGSLAVGAATTVVKGAATVGGAVVGAVVE
jgi:hypothetical protein